MSAILNILSSKTYPCISIESIHQHNNFSMGADICMKFAVNSIWTGLFTSVHLHVVTICTFIYVNISSLNYDRTVWSDYENNCIVGPCEYVPFLPNGKYTPFQFPYLYKDIHHGHTHYCLRSNFYSREQWTYGPKKMPSFSYLHTL